MKRIALFAAALAASSYAYLTPAPADACGGLFCDGGPQPMPVDQTGEDILFVAKDGEVEVHIRIQYEGAAERFAWVIPVQSEPTNFAVGSEQLFTNIKAGSVPTYGLQRQPDACGQNLSGGGSAGAAGDTDGGFGDASGGPPEDDEMDPGVEIVQQKTIGAFDITVLTGDSAMLVVEWLNENGYQQDEEALPIFEEYLAEGHLFAAIKLTGDAGVEEMHPIALTFAGGEPCVPLRLTRIAAMDDMDVRVYFLGEGRVVPRTYRHVLVNPLKIDWPNQAANYKDVITRAVDAEQADGRAFVTEYAGVSSVVSEGQIFGEQWDANVFAGLAPELVVDQLTQQGLFGCGYDPSVDADICQGTHPMVDPLLAEWLVPTGVDPQDFYRNPQQYAADIDLERWADGAEFVRLMQERILDPGQHARELLRTNRYLTRMYTTISPSEMTKDPMFHENKDMPEVPNQLTATQRILCNSDSVWILPDGREVYVAQGDSWPNIGGDKYYEEEVDEVPDFGGPMILVNNTEAINDALAEHNRAAGWRGSTPEESDDGSGCGCRSNGPITGAAWAMLLLLGVGVATRRRR